MTLPSIPWLWKQLNGEQITGITRAIFSFIKQIVDPFMEYFWTFRLMSMNSDHLTTTGALLSFARPVVTTVPANYFRFTTMVTTPTGYGFDDGLLSEMNPQNIAEYKTVLPTELYRQLLIGFTSGEYTFLSLRMLDDIIYTMRKAYGDENEPYTINWVDRNNTPELRHVGDIIINLGHRDKWRQTELVYVALAGLRDNVFTPEPVLYFDSL